MLTSLLLPFVLIQTPETRAAELVAKMTTAEKIGQLMMDAPAIPRLGVPAYHWWNEALHGIARNGVATVFPQAIGLAATWDTEHMHRVATAISIEARAKNNQNPSGIYHGLTLWSPNVNIFRDPRWGRGHETYGEDPFLTGQMGVAFVRGIQGDDPSVLRAVATPKHFAVHSGPEPLRHSFDAKTPERDIFETYLPAFEATVREGKAQSVMAAYSGFNGVPATGNPWLLTDLLREKWGFDGAVVSDVDSVADLWTGHKVAKDAAEASAMALKAGNDLCSGTTYRGIPEALRRGLITEADLDRAATRLFTLRYRLGMFDKVPYQTIPASEIDSPAHDALNLETAKKSLVLLKNDGVLPLKAGTKIAVIGPTADDLGTLVGNYNGDPSHPVTILGGLMKRGNVVFAKGSALAERLDDGRGEFPAGSFFTGEDRQTAGLRREVFAGRRLEGTAIKSDVTRGVNLKWYPPSSPAGIPATDVSMRWTGVFVPPASGQATFGLSADDGMRLYIDDRLVIDDWNENADRLHLARVRLTKDRPVRIRVEFFQAMQDASVRLGWSMVGNGNPELVEALGAAKTAEVIVLALGITPALEGEEMNVNAVGFKGGDRTAIELPKPQRELLAHMTKLGKPVVVVLTGGSAIAFDTKAPNAILNQWYSGGRGGDAVAAALFGDFSPAGRLPLTYYRSTKDLPAFENYAMAGRTYRYFGGRPLFPFGHGLSYTRFQYGMPIVEPLGIVPGNTYRIRVAVTNAGLRDGEEVVQLYARPAKPRPGDARRTLVGFTRVLIPRGTTRDVSFVIPTERLRVWDTASKTYVVRPGEYVLEVGASAEDIRGKVKLRV